MKGLHILESGSQPDPPEGVRVVGIDDPAAGDVFDVLSSDTTRAVLATIYDEPTTAGGLAEEVDTSIQNIKYHIDKLEEVDLIEVADVWYSNQGNKMNVYAPTTETVVMLAGNAESTSRLRQMISRILGVISVLAIVSFIIEKVVQVPESGTLLSSQSASPQPQPIVELGGWITPGSLFFMGGVLILALSGFLFLIDKGVQR